MLLFLWACASTSKSPVVHRIRFHGNGGIFSDTSDANIRRAMKQKENQNFSFLAPDLWMSPYQERMIKDDAHRIETWYAHQGYFQAKFLGWNLQNYPALFSSRPHLYIEGHVHEGEAALIRNIEIQTDLFGSQRKYLSRWVSIKQNDIFRMEDVTYSEVLLQEFLQGRGYAQATVEANIQVWPEVCSNLKYHQGLCVISNMKAHCPKNKKEICLDLQKRIHKCEENMTCIRKIPYESFVKEEAGTVVDITYDIKTGPSYRFGEIHIEGDTRVPLEPLLDKMIFEAKIKPGGKFQIQKLYEAQELIYAMGLFSVVNIKPNFEEESALAHITIELSEALPGEANLGVGGEKEPSRLGLNILARLTHQNLMNRLIQLNWRNEFGYGFLTQTGETNRQFRHGPLGESELRILFPNLYRTWLSFDTTLLGEWGIQQNYNFAFVTLEPSLQFRIPFSFLQADFLTFGIGYLLSYRHYFNVQEAAPDIVPYFLTGLQQEFTLDGRDNTISTSRGHYLSVNVSEEYLISQTQGLLVRGSIEHRLYQPLQDLLLFRFNRTSLRQVLKNRGIDISQLPGVIAARWSIGALNISSPGEYLVPRDTRFFLGGGTDVRGWRPFVLGPYQCRTSTSCIQNGVQLSDDIVPSGGRLRFFTNLEYRYYTPAGYGFVIFADSGRVWQNIENFDLGTLETTVGLGLRYKSSIGPFRFDIAYRLGDNPYFQQESKWGWHIALYEMF